MEAPPPPAPAPPPPTTTLNATGGKRLYRHQTVGPVTGSSSSSASLADALRGTGLSSWRATSFTTKSDTGFVGLSNQGATCYMNSLLQTLFMTPEFRTALFAWRYNPKKDGEERLCIPLQLQRLFARLCLSDCAHVETKNVTDSFGWHGNEVFQQQDVQELIRVLLDAIDKTFCANDLDNPIMPLYRGLLHDYLRCTVCNHSRVRSDAFMDIPLVIRGVSSLEEALDLYMTPELLNKSNQWFCESCQKRVDALKGLKLKDLPPILTFQLKRFDYNYSTMTRIKLNNRVTFPFYLDMGKYHKSDLSDFHTSTSTRAPETDMLCESGAASNTESGAFQATAEAEWACALCTYINLSTQKRCEMCDTPRPQRNDDGGNEKCANAVTHFNVAAAPIPPPQPGDIAKDATAESKSASGNPEEVSSERPHEIRDDDHVYELFSVMIHSGGAMGGHYYAYIKSLKTGRWYSFNDMHVAHITESDVRRTFGDEDTRMNAANAYLLMYRKMAKSSEAPDLPDELVDHLVELDSTVLSQIPDELRVEVEEENKKYAEDKADHQRKLDTLDLRIFYGNAPTMIHIDKSKTLQEATELAYREVNVSEAIPLSCVRLRSYNSTTGTVGTAFSGDEHKALTDLGVFSQRSFLLETKSPSEDWPPAQTEGIALNVIKLNEATLELEPALTVALDDGASATLGQLKSALEAKMDLPKDKQLLLRVMNSDVEILGGNSESKLVQDCKLSDGSLIYVEETKDHGLSLLKQRFEAEQNTIELNFNNPNDGDAELRIAIDQRETIGTLKTRIGAMINLASNEFRLRRKLLNKEYKDENETLQQCYLFDGSALRVEKGRSLKAGEILGKVYIYGAEAEPDFTIIAENVIVGEDDRSSDIIERLKENVGEAFKVLPWDRLRVREKIDSRLGAAMKQGKTLKQTVTALRDGVELALQLVEATAQVELRDDDLLLEARRFCPDTMELKHAEELILEKDSSVLALRTHLGSLYSVPTEYVAVAKPFKHQLGVLSSLMSLNWELSDDVLIMKSPLYLREGDLMLWRDLRDVPKELPAPGANGQPYSITRPKEAGIVIRTIYDKPEPTTKHVEKLPQQQQDDEQQDSGVQEIRTL